MWHGRVHRERGRLKGAPSSTASGQADRPSWSPDGRWIAFRRVDRVVQESGNSETIVAVGTGIVISHPDGTDARTITADGVEAFAWGPASDRLRFISSAGQGSAQTISEATLGGAVQTVEVRIEEAQNLFERTWRPGRLAAPQRQSWNVPGNTGRRCAHVTPRGFGGDAGFGGSRRSEWHMAHAGFPERGRLQADDHRQRHRGRRDHHRRLRRLPGVDLRLVALRFLYATVIDQNETLTLVRRDGHVDSQVDHLTGLDGFSWSPDEKWLGVHGTRDFVLRPDGSGLRGIPSDSTWSPDGRTLGVVGPDGQLLVGGPDGSDLHTVGSFPAPISWSPDGSRFAFVRDGNAWTATRDGADLRNLTSLPAGGASMVVWSPDDRWIAIGVSHGLWL